VYTTCNGNSCSTTCGGDSGCIGTYYCNASAHCSSDKARGSACNNATDCLNGGPCGQCRDGVDHCVDGVCCDTAASMCSASCQRCDSQSTTGTGSCGAAQQGTLCGMNFVCNGTSTSCPSSCGSDADCAPGFSCQPNGKCQ
jgi:hypothetical protein